MRILIADGGTGGHIFPAIAVADEFKQRQGFEAVLFTGTALGLESEILPRHNYELHLIHVGGLIGKRFLTRVKTLMQLPYAYLESRSILQAFRPQVVIGFGAYASGPVLVAAHHKRIPILLIEPNAIPGFTNRTALKYAARVAVPYEDTKGIFQGKAVVTGTPIRPLKALAVQKNKFTLGIFGGSQGSRAINRTVVEALPELALLKDRFHLIHQTGKNDFESVKKRYEETTPFYDVVPFINDVEQFYNRCDLLVSRSGAITLAEITSIGKPAILVPLPTAAHNHQEENARRLSEAGAARMILQKDFTVKVFLDAVRTFLAAPDQLKAMAEASEKMGKPEATRKVVDLAVSLMHD